ncbi:conserved hypothetical protein [Theileria equi strain WA]|uniref:Cytosolic Fe-S cluster assembly factor NUBP1 homolog n=1 Tax=Theileria equi strain WA TaxID=1537102 RepID=L1LBL4_THEEQ|nr:conserved hypothetical protein [Theileria equi strain WA]EKX72807.1 conserved hypothetical protein [Theileria equi strain WA]|eukprot:XP_004832259.1 conserved hypothetical protein [Theileria equi strain WA]
MESEEKKNTSFLGRFYDFVECYQREFKYAFLIASYYAIRKFVQGRVASKNGGDIPEECPGMDSSRAGKSSACEGCPNQSACASGESQRAAEGLKESVYNSLSNIGEVLLVMSGKGGVGKSTISTQLAFALEKQGFRVGLLDIDITGPSIPGMTNTRGHEVYESAYGWTPVYIQDSLAVMSIGYLLQDERAAIIWRGPKKDSLIKHFLTGVHWETLDYLVVDCPPGTSDELITIASLLEKCNKRAILVTTPQKRSVDDVIRSAQFCKDVNIKVAMLVENMTGSVFDSNSGAAADLCKSFHIKNHVKIPSNSRITQAGEAGIALDNFNPFEKLTNLL